ncbi:uncharacterized protein [Antedon mediterranea]|uniref:uncharacterized protein n=1 Tax=Antedon mediterranea TaxID=105859 RepID=UPI003AF72453
MQPNPAKCNVMHVHFMRNEPNYVPLTIGDNVLEEKSVVKLLGVLLQKNMKWDYQVNEMISKSSRRLFMLYILKRYGAPRDDLVFTYITYIRPLLEYASPLWHSAITKQQCTQLEFVKKRAFKIIIGYNNYTGYQDTLEILNITSLQDRRLGVLAKFGSSLVTSGRFTSWIPENIKPERTLRSFNKYCVPRCRTNRYGNSTLPSAIRILNK